MRLQLLPFFVFILLLASLPFASAVLAAPANESGEKIVSTKLVVRDTIAKRGEELPVGLLMSIRENWHTYWEYPGDSGTAARFTWELPAGFTANEIKWPLPSRIDAGPLTTYGYSGEVFLAAGVNVPQDFQGDHFTIKMSAEWLVCEIICIPEYADYEVVVAVADTVETDPRAKVYFDEAEKRLPVAKTWPVTLSQYGQQTTITIRDVPSEFAEQYLLTGEFFPLDWGVVENPGEARLTMSGPTITLHKNSGSRKAADVSPYRFVLTVKDNAGDYQAVLLSTGDPAETVAINAPSPEPEALIKTKLLNAILLAFMGGLILNLMPCVFPILSMKALHLVNTAHGQKRDSILHGLSYTAGVIISFLIVAGLLIALRSAGASIGWGFQLQNPLVLLALVWLVFLVGLNLSGMFEFNMRFTNVGSRLSQSNGLTGAFFTGFLATIVATPCTAPFMGVALGYAITQSWYIALWVFATLGLGLAFPFLLLSFSPNLQKLLPRPGAWMDNFRRFLAFPMFMTAIWLVWVIAQQSGAGEVAAALLGCLGFAFAIWLWSLPAGRYYVARAVAIGTLFLVLVLIPFSVAQRGADEAPASIGQASAEQAGWEAYSAETLDAALASGNPVFVNMTAAWCITCKVNERVAIETNEVRAIFAAQNTQLIKGDWTNYDAAITAYLAKFDRNGVPLYVYYGKPDVTGKRPEPVLLPQILTAGIIKDHITK